MTLYCGTHNWLCLKKMLNHGLNHGFFLSLFKLISCPIHWIVCVLAYLNSILNFRVVLVLPKTAGSAQTHKSMSFIWSTLYVYLCLLLHWVKKCSPFLRKNNQKCTEQHLSLFIGCCWYKNNKPNQKNSSLLHSVDLELTILKAKLYLKKIGTYVIYLLIT